MGRRNKRMALVLMWPDYQAEGTFGLECVKKYVETIKRIVAGWSGNKAASFKLILVGEWSSGGQSFAPACQDFVSQHFAHTQSLGTEEMILPRWPLFADTVQVFEWRNDLSS